MRRQVNAVNTFGQMTGCLTRKRLIGNLLRLNNTSNIQAKGRENKSYSPPATNVSWLRLEPDNSDGLEVPKGRSQGK